LPAFVLKNAYVVINSVNLSNHVRSVTINYGAEMLEKTAMSANSKQRIAGLKDWSVDIEFNQDFAAASVDATLFPLVGAAAFPIEIRPDAGAVGPTNPKYTGNALLESYPPISGSVGELATVSITLQGDGDLTRATA
jgi:predicted secreted protein